MYREAALPILWAYSFVLPTAAWLVTWLLGAPLLGTIPVPALWGMLIATISLVQLWVGVWMDRRHDPSVTRYYAWAAWSPLIYWIQMAIITAISTPGGLLHPRGEGTRHTPREAETAAERVPPALAPPAAVRR